MGVNSIKYFGCILLIVLLYSCNTQYTKEREDRLTDFLLLNVLNTKGAPFPQNSMVSNEDGEQLYLKSIFESPKLVLRIDGRYCDNCVVEQIELIKKHISFPAENVIGIATYDNIRAMKVLKANYKINFPLFFINAANSVSILPYEFEQLNFPYVFLMNSSLEYSSIFSPSNEFTAISNQYYTHINHTLENNKRATNISLFHNDTINYGNINIGQEKIQKVYFQNTKTEPMIIQDIKTSCGCTVIDWRKEPLLPQETGILQVNFKPTNLGINVKKIFVHHNLSHTPTVLFVKANVIQ